MKKVIYALTLLVVLIILVTLFKISGTKSATTDRDYLIYYKNFSIDSSESLLFPVAERNGNYLFDYQELYKPLYQFFCDDGKNHFNFENSVPQLSTNKYLSIEAIFVSNEASPLSTKFRTSITIDLKEGKVLTLEDLLEISPEFINQLKSGRLAKTDFESETGDVLDFSIWSDDEIKVMMESCSTLFTSDNYIIGFQGSKGIPLSKPTFFLAPGKIYFANFDVYGHLFYLETSDISNFLKVKSW